MISFFDEFFLSIIAHLVDKSSGYWNVRSYWRVSQVVEPELKSYSKRKPFRLWSAKYKVELQTELLRSNSRLGSLIILSGTVYTGVEVCRMDLDLWNDLSQIRYSLVVILELNGVSEVQYKDVMMISINKNNWCC